jgi:uncharacterized protein involved in response to NO
MDSTGSHRSISDAKQKHSSSQEPFARARPWIVASCALGLGVGFMLATILSVTQALELPLGLWWVALVQAHGHVQLFGWAGLFVLGVALHFLPRLRGTPLAYPRMTPWLLTLLGGGLTLRVLSQPLLAAAAPGAHLWQVLLAVAGLAEGVGASGVAVLFCLTFRRGLSLAKRPALLAFLPYALGGLFCFWLALTLNAIEGVRLLLAGQALLSDLMDLTITQLGLFGFLVPIALGMAARLLPLYLGLRPLSARALWPVFASYVAGLTLSLFTFWLDDSAALVGYLQGVGSLLMGGALLAFIGLQGILLPQRWARLMIPSVQTKHGSLPARPYSAAQGNDRAAFGPFAWLIRSAFGWLALAGLALCADGAEQLAGGFSLVSMDAIRHATTVGFVMLLIFGVGQRMLPGFAGSSLLSPRLVTATLWLGSAAAFLRVAPGLVSPWLDNTGFSDWFAPLLRGAFGLSGPLALVAVFCFTLNLWRVLYGGPRAASHPSREEQAGAERG